MPCRHRDAQFLEQRPGAQGNAGPCPAATATAGGRPPTPTPLPTSPSDGRPGGRQRMRGMRRCQRHKRQQGAAQRGVARCAVAQYGSSGSRDAAGCGAMPTWDPFYLHILRNTTVLRSITVILL